MIIPTSPITPAQKNCGFGFISVILCAFLFNSIINSLIMRNFLLSVGLMSLGAFAAQASEVTLSMASATDIQGDWVDKTVNDDGSVKAYAHYDNVTSLKLGDYLFELAQSEGASANAYYEAADPSAYTLRVYRGNSVTITAPTGEPMGTIQLTCTTVKAVSDQNVITASVGGVSYDDKVITWTNSEAVESVTLTLPTNKVGSDNPQIRISEVTISSNTGDVPGPVEPAGTVIYENSCMDESCGFVVENLKLPEELEYVWTISDRYGLKASSFLNNENYEVDSYMVSPALDLTAATSSVTLAFEQATNYFNDYTADCGVYVREVGSDNWESLGILPEQSNSWNFAPVELSMDQYAGKNVQIGFRYTCDGVKAGTWEIKNVKVTSANSSFVEKIESVQTSEAVYYDINGRRVNGTPECGLYIKVADGVATKVMLK